MWERGSDDDEAPLRTLEGMRELRDAWLASGSDPSKLKFYGCCRDVPIELLPQEGTTAKFTGLSGLHIILGVVDQIVREVETVDPKVTQFLQRLSISRTDYAPTATHRLRTDYHAPTTHRLPRTFS